MARTGTIIGKIVLGPRWRDWDPWIEKPTFHHPYFRAENSLRRQFYYTLSNISVRTIIWMMLTLFSPLKKKPNRFLRRYQSRIKLSKVDSWEAGSGSYTILGEILDRFIYDAENEVFYGRSENLDQLKHLQKRYHSFSPKEDYILTERFGLVECFTYKQVYKKDFSMDDIIYGSELAKEWVKDYAEIMNTLWD